ncbi:MAG: hypothetical protein NVS3B10_22920 [Polyangiales bacterium]
MYGVSFDSVEDNRAFAEKFEFNFPLLCDTSRALGIAYGAASDAKTSHAARVGVVIGPDGTIKEWSAKVDARAYPQEVVARL